MALKDRIQFLFDNHKKNVDPKLTKADFARSVGVSRASVSDWMSGVTKEIKGDLAHSVANLFGANAEYVQTGNGEIYKSPSKDEAEKVIIRVVEMATAAINSKKPDMSKGDRVKAISLCLMHYSLDSFISEDELRAMIDRVVDM